MTIIMNTHIITHRVAGQGWGLLPAIALGCLLTAVPVLAHFPILIHDGGLKGEDGEVDVTFAVGHPFELEFVEARRPAEFQWMDPQGRVSDLSAGLKPTTFRGRTNTVAWRVSSERVRGDGWFLVASEPEVDEAAKVIYQEWVKVCAHHERQGGWTRVARHPLEIVPLTRPYGLRAGMAFSGRLLNRGKPMANAEVYFEHLSDEAPVESEMPPEPLVTFSVRTDDEGRFVLSLPDGGWWVMGAYAEGLGLKERGGVEYQLEGFAGLWVFVEER
jgi:cobalt/nickel transport protein